MAVYFFDSSALVKQYVSEIGSSWIVSITRLSSGNLIYIGRITTIEIVAAISRRVKIGTLTASDAASAITRFRNDINSDYRIIELTPSLANRAIRIAETHQLRGYDAVQLAASLSLRDKLMARGVISSSFPYILVSADNELNNAAILEGLAVDNPNNHP